MRPLRTTIRNMALGLAYGFECLWLVVKSLAVAAFLPAEWLVYFARTRAGRTTLACLLFCFSAWGASAVKTEPGRAALIGGVMLGLVALPDPQKKGGE